jgi:hypothetical protein
MCEGRVVCLQSVLHFLARRVPRIILQRVEEMLPAARESMVSVLCLCAQKKFSCHHLSVLLARGTKYVLTFIIFFNTL